MNIKDIHVGDYVRFTDEALLKDHSFGYSSSFGKVVKVIEICETSDDLLRVSGVEQDPFQVWVAYRFSPVSPLESAVLEARGEKAC